MNLIYGMKGIYLMRLDSLAKIVVERCIRNTTKVPTVWNINYQIIKNNNTTTQKKASGWFSPMLFLQQRKRAPDSDPASSFGLPFGSSASDAHDDRYDHRATLRFFVQIRLNGVRDGVFQFFLGNGIAAFQQGEYIVAHDRLGFMDQVA